VSTTNTAFINELESIIRSRRTAVAEQSYTKTLFNRGTPFIAQKVGEEAVELAIAAVLGDREQTIAEASDLVYHLLVLLEANEISLADVAAELSARHANQ
jgi:phosphoribosyl-ATP pyrophosphohydrolase/phosphoribosyl-AMP cyclohydrolase